MRVLVEAVERGGRSWREAFAVEVESTEEEVAAVILSKVGVKGWASGESEAGAREEGVVVSG